MRDDFDSDKCVLGMENKTRINGMEKAVEKIEKCVIDLTNHYSKRLPTWATVMITILSSTVVGLGVYFLTRGH